jgi:hypothetical protein
VIRELGMDKEPKVELKPILDRIPAGWGQWVDVGPGWEPIVLELNQQLSAIDPAYEVHQVKEKFGGLRYYCSLDGNEQAVGLIRAAEARAAVTCEQCSKPGGSRDGSWIRTLCDGCYLESLNNSVTGWILRAERASTEEGRLEAHHIVCDIEQKIVAVTSPDTTEGLASRIGAVTAAMSAGNLKKAVELADQYLAGDLNEAARAHLKALRDEAAR